MAIPTGPAFTSIWIALDIETDSGAESRVRDLVRSVERACIISRAIDVPIEITNTVRGRE